MRQTKIYVLSLTLLKNDKHMAIAEYMAAALRMFSIAETSLAFLVTAYTIALEKEDEAFQRIDRKALTRKVNNADTDRINALRALRDAVRVFFFRPDQKQKELAENVSEVIDLYGGTEICDQSVDSRTGNISNLVKDLENLMPDAIAALSLTEYVQTLKAANELFLQCQADRNLSDAEHGKKVMLEARAATDNAWRAIVETTNNIIAYGPMEEVEVLVPFAKYMNVEIEKYRIQNGQGVVGGSGSSSGTNRPTDDEGVSGGGGTETTPTMKDATFRKADGTAIVIPFAVGAPIEYPANTVGYKWKPLLEVMPKTNKTFTEVPIVDRETIATFHFADHTEEEIRQFVGTLLHTPANTDGYFWQPTPPETMPAEDTQYYEQPINNDNNQGGDNTGGDQTGGGSGDNTGGSGENTGGSGDNTGGGNNGGYPPGYDPDADDDPGV